MIMFFLIVLLIFNHLSYSVLSSVDMVLIPVNPDSLVKKTLNYFIEGLIKRLKSTEKLKISIFLNKAKIIRDIYLTTESKKYLQDIKGVQSNLDKVGTKVTVFDCFLPENIELQKVIQSPAFPEEYEEHCNCLMTNINKIIDND